MFVFPKAMEVTVSWKAINLTWTYSYENNQRNEQQQLDK